MHSLYYLRNDYEIHAEIGSYTVHTITGARQGKLYPFSVPQFLLCIFMSFLFTAKIGMLLRML